MNVFETPPKQPAFGLGEHGLDPVRNRGLFPVDRDVKPCVPATPSFRNFQTIFSSGTTSSKVAWTPLCHSRSAPDERSRGAHERLRGERPDTSVEVPMSTSNWKIRRFVPLKVRWWETLSGVVAGCHPDNFCICLSAPQPRQTKRSLGAHFVQGEATRGEVCEWQMSLSATKPWAK